MKTTLNLTFLGLFFSCGFANAKIEKYEIDPHHTNARFSIDHFNTSTNIGGFFDLTGSLKFDSQKNNGFIDINIPIEKLQTGSTEFTHHLKTADLFNAKKYPQMRFISNKWNIENNKLSSIQGNLTLLGKTRPVTLKVEKFNCYDSPISKTKVCGGDFSTTIDRTDWGMNYLVDSGMAKTVKIDIQIEAAKK